MKHLFMVMAAVLMVFSGLVAHSDSSPPQVRQDSDFHWEWFDEKWPNAEQAKMIQKAAEAGDPQAQFRLALMHDAGKGVKQDSAKAARWLQKAAEQGHVEAQYNLATMYDIGHGVAQDYTEAAKWYRTAAGQGYTSAQKNLGAKYGMGQGVPKNNVEAYVWSAIAAQSGDEGAVKNRDIAVRGLSADELAKAQDRVKLLTRQIEQIKLGK
jgi:TPR repeat protein